MRTQINRRQQQRRKATTRMIALLAAFAIAIFAAGALLASALRPETPQGAPQSTQEAYSESADTYVGKITLTLPDGTVIAYSSTANPTTSETEYKHYDVPLSDELQEYTQDLCRAYGLQYEMVLALMSAETGYRADIISRTNDYGLMQINKVNHQRLTETLGITDYLDPYQNIYAGVYMLSEIADKYDTPQEILMVYNCGHSGAKRLWAKGITSTKYTANVIDQMNKLERR